MSTKRTKVETVSLSAISRVTGISMPSLLRYKKEHLDIIDGKFVGKLARFARGEDLRGVSFVKTAIPLFFKFRQEGLNRRGRPRKS